LLSVEEHERLTGVIACLGGSGTPKGAAVQIMDNVARGIEKNPDASNKDELEEDESLAERS